jgi:hypothetical protein
MDKAGPRDFVSFGLLFLYLFFTTALNNFAKRQKIKEVFYDFLFRLLNFIKGDSK